MYHADFGYTAQYCAAFAALQPSSGWPPLASCCLAESTHLPTGADADSWGWTEASRALTAARFVRFISPRNTAARGTNRRRGAFLGVSRWSNS